MNQQFDFFSPQNLPDLLQIIQKTGGTIIAGGTDIIPKLSSRTVVCSNLIDISQVTELNFIEKKENSIWIGARTTHASMLSSSILQAAAPSLVQAVSAIGCPQTRNSGTIGGNIANASPAADTIPPLLTLNAMVKLVSLKGERIIPLEQFLVGPGKTMLGSGEIIHSIGFDKPEKSWKMLYQKIGRRKGMAIAVVSCAILAKVDTHKQFSKLQISLGSVAPTPVRAYHTEAVLINQKMSEHLHQMIQQSLLLDISPISDIRASSIYRQKTALGLTIKLLTQATNNKNIEAEKML